jgi:hypothetical protein
MSSRLTGRLLTLYLAIIRRLQEKKKREKPRQIKKILICHQLLLGDTITLAPLFAKLRAQHPNAEIAMAGPKAYLPLFSTNPWGVKAYSFDLRHPHTVRSLLRHGGYDLALLPGDNRYSWLAQALGSKWIIGFGGNSSWHKNLFIDEFRRWPSEAMALGDIFATLAQGPSPEPYTTDQWQTPQCQPFEIPAEPFVVFHVGASSPLKLWAHDRWNTLALEIEAIGFKVVFTPGKGETPLVDKIDPKSHFQRLDLDLAQMFKLLRQTELVVSPDTGIAHLARAAGAPSITLFGPGSSTAFGPGNFWSNASWQGISKKPFPCRNQHKIFGRNSPNISRCYRSTTECKHAKCMDAISVDTVLAACKSMLKANTK